MPVIIISSLTQHGSAKALEALQAGAIEVMAKPSSGSTDGTQLATKIRAASQARLRARIDYTEPGSVRPKTVPSAGPASSRLVQAGSRTPAAALRPISSSSRNSSSKQLILMGASTGGTEALKEVLTSLSGNLPGICIVQHIPAHFSRAFAERLNELCAFEVREARQGDKVQPGLALIAPGGHHLVLRRVGALYQVEINDGPLVHHQRPAVDVLFDSAVRAGAGPGTLAFLLTGMGADGAAGMLKLKEAGATTVAQDEASCVVFGMPREAIRLGAAQTILPLEQMAGFIERQVGDTAAPGVKM